MPGEEIYLWDKIAIENLSDVELFMADKTSGYVEIEGNKAGGYIEYLPSTGWFLVRVFPNAANMRIVRKANLLAVILLAYLVVLYSIILVSLVVSYRKKQKQIEVANDAKTVFLFNMSHDIRTPMNAITGYTNMAIRDIDDKEKVKDSLVKIQKAGDILLALINDVLDMSRIESGKVSVNPEKCDVHDSFSGIENMLEELARAADIELSFYYENIRHEKVYADISRVERVLVNIISNAIKYTQEGGKVNVTVEETESDTVGYGMYKYTVEDNGIGMSEEFAKKCFDNFTREETTTASGIQGTGLGLPIAKSLVEIMGGTIDCKSREGSGTTFTIELPFKLQKNAVSEREETDKKEKKVFDLLGYNVLLVDDNEFNREIASDILADEGMHVTQAESGKEAIKKVNEHVPQYYGVILMDVQMPFMDGYETTRIIRESHPNYHIPIIALSANAFESDVKKSLEAGMDGHVAKPIDIDQLKSALEKVLNDTE